MQVDSFHVIGDLGWFSCDVSNYYFSTANVGYIFGREDTFHMGCNLLSAFIGAQHVAVDVLLPPQAMLSSSWSGDALVVGEMPTGSSLLGLESL